MTEDTYRYAIRHCEEILASDLASRLFHQAKSQCGSTQLTELAKRPSARSVALIR